MNVIYRNVYLLELSELRNKRKSPKGNTGERWESVADEEKKDNNNKLTLITKHPENIIEMSYVAITL